MHSQLAGLLILVVGVGLSVVWAGWQSFVVTMLALIGLGLVLWDKDEVDAEYYCKHCGSVISNDEDVVFDVTQRGVDTITDGPYHRACKTQLWLEASKRKVASENT